MFIPIYGKNTKLLTTIISARLQSIPRLQNLAIASNWIIAALLSRLRETKSSSFCKVLLVVFLCSVKLFGRQNLSNNLPVQQLLLPFHGLQSFLLLLWCVIVYSRSVLRSYITSLAIRRGGIMASPESIKQRLIATFLRVILNTNDLRMVGSTRTNIVIRRIVDMPLGIPNLGLGNTKDSLERQFDTPETPGAELRELLARSGDVVVWTLRDRRRR